MKVYLDEDFKCYINSADGRIEAETPFFDGKCPEFIEGYRFVPSGETWAREDGVEFQGEMIAPWKPYSELELFQLKYELEDAKAALKVLGVE